MPPTGPSILSVDDFLSRFKETLCLRDLVCPFTFVLGSGFSHGVIPITRDIIPEVARWLREEQNSAKSLADFRREFWARVNCRLNDVRGDRDRELELDTDGSPTLSNGDRLSNAYSAAMLHGLSSPYLRRRFFRTLCANAENQINLAHLYLASMLHAQELPTWKQRFDCHRLCTTIFTTNFDPLLQIALQLVSKLYYMTDRPRTLETPHDDDHSAIHLIYTHGSIHQAALANTNEEIVTFAKLQARRLPDYFKRHGVIVIGYSGWNDACMNALEHCDQFDHNLYWCDIHPRSELKTRLRSNVYTFLREHRDNAFYVQIENADLLMQRMHEHLGLGLAPTVIENPLPPLLDRIRQIRLPTEERPQRENT